MSFTHRDLESITGGGATALALGAAHRACGGRSGGRRRYRAFGTKPVSVRVTGASSRRLRTRAGPWRSGSGHAVRREGDRGPPERGVKPGNASRCRRDRPRPRARADYRGEVCAQRRKDDGIDPATWPCSSRSARRVTAHRAGSRTESAGRVHLSVSCSTRSRVARARRLAVGRSLSAPQRRLNSRSGTATGSRGTRPENISVTDPPDATAQSADFQRFPPMGGAGFEPATSCV